MARTCRVLTEWQNGGAAAGPSGSTSQGNGAGTRGLAAGASSVAQTKSGSHQKPGHEERAGIWPTGAEWWAAAASSPFSDLRPASDSGGNQSENTQVHARQRSPWRVPPRLTDYLGIEWVNSLRRTPSCALSTERLAQEGWWWLWS